MKIYEPQSNKYIPLLLTCSKDKCRRGGSSSLYKRKYLSTLQKKKKLLLKSTIQFKETALNMHKINLKKMI